MIKVDNTYFFTEYYTDKYIILIPKTTSSVIDIANYVRLFKSNGVIIGNYSQDVVPKFILELKDPENISSGEEVDQLVERFLKLKAFL